MKGLSRQRLQINHRVHDANLRIVRINGRGRRLVSPWKEINRFYLHQPRRGGFRSANPVTRLTCEAQQEFDMYGPGAASDVCP